MDNLFRINYIVELDIMIGPSQVSTDDGLWYTKYLIWKSLILNTGSDFYWKWYGTWPGKYKIMFLKVSCKIAPFILKTTQVVKEGVFIFTFNFLNFSNLISDIDICSSNINFMSWSQVYAIVW
jgi:hypothetical protein